jgi:hypothetical protein
MEYSGTLILGTATIGHPKGTDYHPTHSNGRPLFTT